MSGGVQVRRAAILAFLMSSIRFTGVSHLPPISPALLEQPDAEHSAGPLTSVRLPQHHRAAVSCRQQDVLDH